MQSERKLQIGYVCTWTFSEDVEIVSTDSEKVITYKKPIEYKQYEVFDCDDLIPSVVDTVNKIKQGKNKEKMLLNWVKKWGFLRERLHYFRQPGDDDYLESMNELEYELKKIEAVWSIYRGIANRDKEELKKRLNIQKAPKDYKYEYTYQTKWQETESPYIYEEEDPFSINDLQMNAIMIILDEIDEILSNVALSSGKLSLREFTNYDEFKIEPRIRIKNLKDAIYMQIYLMLGENNKKVCPICNKGFVPSRIDKKYCSDSCYLTAKSRRYRKPKEQK
jgi:predicted nucleic acid-binding Zn ribbon protein